MFLDFDKFRDFVTGVHTVFVNPEKGMVTVRGKVDPMIVLKAIAKTGYSAELLSYQKEPKIEDNERWYEPKKKHRKEKRKHNCPGKHHKCEAYVPPEIDLEICRDPYCKQHIRRPIITDRVTSRCSAGHPRHVRGFLSDYGNSFGCLCPRMLMPYSLYSGTDVHGHGGFNKFTYFGDSYARGCTIM